MDGPESLTNWIHSLGLSDRITSDVRNRLEALGFDTLKSLLQDGQKSDLELSGVPSHLSDKAWTSLMGLQSSSQTLHDGASIGMTLELDGKPIKFIVPYEELLTALKGVNKSDNNNWVEISVSPDQYMSMPGRTARVNFTVLQTEAVTETRSDVQIAYEKRSMLHRWSLCSSLSDEEWQEATNGGKPLIEWSVKDVMHWVMSFEPLKKYADKFDKVDGKYVIDLIFTSENDEEESSQKIDKLADTVGMVMRAHRRLFSNELTLLVRSCHTQHIELSKAEEEDEGKEQALYQKMPSPSIEDDNYNSLVNKFTAKSATSSVQPTISSHGSSLPVRPMSASPQSSGSSGGSSLHPNRRINMNVSSPRSKSKSPCTPVDAYTEMVSPRLSSKSTNMRSALKRQEVEQIIEVLDRSPGRKNFQQWESISDDGPDDDIVNTAMRLDTAVFSRRDVLEGGMVSPAARLQASSRRYSDQDYEMRSPRIASLSSASMLKRNTLRNAKSTFQRGTSAPVPSNNGMTSPNNRKKPILPSPSLTSPVPKEYTSKQKKNMARKSDKEQSKAIGSGLTLDVSDDELNSTLGGTLGQRAHTMPGLALNLDMVNSEFEDANEMSYELTDAGTLITSGFRIDTHGISAAPSRSGSKGGSRVGSRGVSRQGSEKLDNAADSPHMSDSPHVGKGVMLGAEHISQVDTRMKWGATKDGLVILEELGRGAAGCVRKALYVPELLLVAVKDVPVHDDNRRRQLLRELKMLNDIGNALLPNDCMLPNEKEVNGISTGKDTGRDAPLTPPSRRYPSENGYHPDDHHRTPKGEKNDTNRAILLQSIDDDELNSSFNKMPNSEPCPYIVSCLDAYTDLANGSICLVLEFMNAGSLEGFIKTKAKDPLNVMIPERLIAMVADSVLEGLKVIHSRKQLHRDIKPSNILLDCSNNIKISDFGVGKELNSMSLANSFTGTLTYMSPERMAGNDYSYSSDVWSVGICLLALAQGKLPLPTNLGYWALVRAVQDEPSPMLEAVPEGHPAWSSEFHSFLKLCLIKDPDERPLPHQLLQHPFIMNYRAQASQIPGSPPVKPTPGLVSKLRDIAKSAAEFHAKKIIPDFNIESLNLIGFESRAGDDEQPHLKLGMKKNKWLPDADVGKLSSLASQLNMTLDVVSDVFRSVWADVNDSIDKHFTT